MMGTLRFACMDAGEERKQDAEALPILRNSAAGWAKKRSDVPIIRSRIWPV
ncbi:MAG: hypothetical protein WBN51_11765 [Gammaproteobacteria bacterium]|jgi:hypothetical protein